MLCSFAVASKPVSQSLRGWRMGTQPNHLSPEPGTTQDRDLGLLAVTGRDLGLLDSMEVLSSSHPNNP